MKKILFVANIHKHFRAFHIPYIKWLKSKGYEVHVAANDGTTLIEEADKQFNILINRNPFSFQNIKATFALKKIIKAEQYCLIHCHTAMGAVTTRLAAKTFRKEGLKVLYTAHGFHFYKGSPIKYWLLYYPVEKYLSKYTDAILTINHEDYQLVKSKKFKNLHTFLIPGVGIDTSKFENINFNDKQIIKQKNGYSNDTFMILYIAEFIDRKNHSFLLQATQQLQKKISNFKIILAGRGKMVDEIKTLSKKLGVENNVDFLGFRKDIGDIIMMCDIGLSVSKQEGLPMNIAEEMYAQKPVLASKIRGHLDLIDHSINGFLFEEGNIEQFIKYVLYLFHNPKERIEMGKRAKEKSQKFELENSLKEMKIVYKIFLDISD